MDIFLQYIASKKDGIFKKFLYIAWVLLEMGIWLAIEKSGLMIWR